MRFLNLDITKVVHPAGQLRAGNCLLAPVPDLQLAGSMRATAQLRVGMLPKSWRPASYRGVKRYPCARQRAPARLTQRAQRVFATRPMRSRDHTAAIRKRIHLLHRLRPCPQRPCRAAPHQVTRHSASLGRRLDLSGSARSSSGNGPRRARTEAVSLSSPLARSSRRDEVLPPDRLRTGRSQR